MAKVLESNDYYWIGILFLFLLINFNVSIGQIYGQMLMLTWMAYFVARMLGKPKTIPINRARTGWVHDLAVGVVGYAVFLLSTSLIFKMVGWGELSSINSIIELVGATFSQVPVLAQSKFMSLVSWGYLIPWIETAAIAMVLVWLAHKFSISPNKKFTKSLIVLFIFISAGFSLYHLSAKGITNNAALATTFIFSMVTLVLIVWFDEVKPAINMHVISNTIATMYLLGISIFAVGGTPIVDYLPGAAIIIGTAYLMNRVGMFTSYSGLRRKNPHSA